MAKNGITIMDQNDTRRGARMGVESEECHTPQGRLRRPFPHQGYFPPRVPEQGAETWRPDLSPVPVFFAIVWYFVA